MSCLTQSPPASVVNAMKFSMEKMTTERLLNRMPDLTRKRRANRQAYAHHRKSAVELLEASKSAYVKSLVVLNHKQELKHPENLSVSARETNTVLSLSHTKTEVEPTHPPVDNRQTDDIRTGDKLATSSGGVTTTSNESVQRRKTPPPIPPRKHSPTSGGRPVEASRNTVIQRQNSAGIETSKQSSTETSPSTINMSDTDKPGRCKSFTGSGNSNPDQIVKRFSSLSASAAMTETPIHGDREAHGAERGSTVSAKSYGKDSYSSSICDSPLKPMCYNSLSTSVGVLVEQPRPQVTKLEKMDENGEVRRRRQLHRSHSDLSSCRHSRTSSDFSDLSSRLSRTSTEIERFFNEMGLDRSVLDPMLRIQDCKKKDFLDNLSSIDSQDSRSLLSGASRSELDKVPAESEQDLMDRAASGTSVVERNARIIKWLCNVKKARNNGPRQPITSS